MTDRVHAFTVALERDMRDDDAEALATAIRCLRGVKAVTAETVEPGTYVARVRMHSQLIKEFNEWLSSEPFG